MKVKIGDKVYDSKNEIIMLIVSEEEKAHIGAMPEEHVKFCTYPRDTMASVIDNFMYEVSV